MSFLETQFSSEIHSFENYVQDFFKSRRPENNHWNLLYESVEYSVGNGGKRFRPILALLTAELFDRPQSDVLPLAAAVEFIHTYYLIHDDLPVMDNDDVRRGKPSNHKVYGEGIALLAGDGLQALAFEVLTKGLSESNAFKRARAVQLLAEAAGVDGMVGGQVIDIALLKGSKSSESEVHLMQGMKTGALIRVAVEAAAVLCSASYEEQESLRKYAEQTGLAFQLSDDILDFDESQPEASGWPAMIGLQATHEKLKAAVDAATLALKPFGVKAERLRSLVSYNLKRQQ